MAGYDHAKRETPSPDRDDMNELAVAQGNYRIFVGRGGEKPSPLAIITMTVDRTDLDHPQRVAVEMTRRQAHHLANALLAAAELPGIAEPESPPETT